MQIFFTLLTVFCAVFFLILLVRLVFNFIINRAYRRYLKLKKVGRKIFPATRKNYRKEEEELLRKLEIPRAHSAIKAENLNKKNQHQSGNYELMSSSQTEMEKEEMRQTTIVDFVKPVGFWTSMILGQKLTYLIQSAQILNKRGNKGFWASMIEAKERAAGRQHSRSR